MKKFFHFISAHKFLSIFVTVMILAILAIALPFASTNGASSFTGIEKEVAVNAVQKAENTTDRMSEPFFVNAKVKSVYAGPPKNGVCFSSTPYSSDPSRLEHYGAEVSFRTLFGIEYKTLSYHSCQDLGR
jgi:hypothetical protein